MLFSSHPLQAPVSLSLRISALRIPFRTSFKHASADRKLGESIWVEATRDGLAGLGEGCPRVYVTGEDVESGIKWLLEIKEHIQQACTSLPRLIDWVMQNRDRIDAHPSAWCALEMALLDLFAREQQLSVEALFGLGSPLRTYSYSAVLGNSAPEVFGKRVEMYLQYGFSDFKVKIEGELERDQSKLEHLLRSYEEHKGDTPRIRLDANNLWAGKTQEAISYMQQLKVSMMGIEEPVEPANYEALSTISSTLDISVILDESLCRLDQLAHYDALQGTFIANLKVSRVGGVLRALELVQALRDHNWPIIIGAHVGETSILTRAAMCVAQAAGDSLIAQEGGFGTRLLEYDNVSPCLMFGAGGQLSLASAEEDSKIGDTGWGLQVL